MHKLASCLVLFFLSPVNWVIVLTLICFFTKKNMLKKYTGMAALVIFLLFSNSWLFNSYAKFWQSPESIAADAGEVYSCAIVLGGFAYSPDDSTGHFSSSSDRFIQTLKLFKLGKASHIIIAGGNANRAARFKEGAWAKEQFKVMGVPDSVISFEDRSANTADNAANAKHLLDSLKYLPPYWLVTSASHMPRAKLLFDQQGLSTIPYPCNYDGDGTHFSLRCLIPNMETLMNWNTYFKETAAYLIYKVKGK